MDALSAAVVDVVLATAPLPPALNFVHPHRAAWRDVFRAVNDATGAQLPFVPYKEWLARLEVVAAQENSQENLEKMVSAPSVLMICSRLSRAHPSFCFAASSAVSHTSLWTFADYLPTLF